MSDELRKDDLLYFIGEYLTPVLREALADGRVKKIDVTDNNTCLDIKADFEKIITKENLSEAQNLVKKVTGLKSVRICCCYAPELFGESYYPELIKEIKEYDILAGSMLENAAFAFDDNQLTVTVKDGADLLCNLKLDDKIRTIAEDHFGILIGVELKQSEKLSTPPAPIVPPAQNRNYPEPQVPTLRDEKPLIRERKPGKEADLDGLDLLYLSRLNLDHNQVNSIPLVTIDSIGHKEQPVCVKGSIFGADVRDTKSGNKIINFYITDKTNSYSVKVMGNPDKCADLLGNLKDGTYLLIFGKVEYDDYSKEFLIRPDKIYGAKPPKVTDNSEEKRVELHLHTNFSQMDGLTPAGKLVKRAAEWGHKAIAITDHGVVQAFPDAAAAAKETGVKIIYGMEGYYVDDSVTAVTGDKKMPFDGTYVIFDVETTGLRTGYDRLIEIGAVKYNDGVEVSSFQSFVDPEREIPEKIVSLTGITKSMVRGAPKEGEAVRKFFEWAGEDAILVAHNATFDTDIMKATCERNNIEYNYTHIDTLVVAQELVEEIKRFTLDNVAKALKLPNFDHHRADEDARILALIFEKLVERMKAMGINSTEEINAVIKPDPRKLKSYHMILLVKNLVGLKNLYQMITASNLEYFRRNPRIPLSVLNAHREGIIVGSACEAGQLYQAVLAGKSHDTLVKYAKVNDYLEIQPNGNNAFMIRDGIVEDEEALNDINRQIIALADELDMPVVATGDVHFIDPDDAIHREIIMNAQGFSDADKQAPLYFRTTDDMLKQFEYLGEERAKEIVITNPNKIADMCEEIKPIPDGTYPPHIDGADEDLRRICNERMEALYGAPLPDYIRERLDKELNSIIEHGFAVLYMIAQKLVKNSMDNGYYVGSRGSVGSSFVAFAAGISEVNPLAPHYLCTECKHSEFFLKGEYGSGYDMPVKNCPNCNKPMVREGHDIPFETFLGFYGDKSPDIDLNFSSEYQFYAHRYTEELFGKSHVFKAGTVGTVADKTAFGYVKKWVEENLERLNITQEKRRAVGEDLTEEEYKKRKYLLEITNAEMLRLASGCTGVKRTTGQHPGGMVVVPGDREAEDFTPIQHPADDPDSIHRTTHFDFHSLHDTILKLDNLGHEVPTMYKHLEDLTGTSVMDADVCDPKLYQLLTSPEPLGVTAEDIECPTGTLSLPELGTPFVLGMLTEAQPKCFSDMLQISGLSHGTDVWLGNAQELIKDGTCTISDVIGTRDSIMVYLIHKGVDKGMAFKIMEIVRKGKAPKLLTDEHKQAMLDNGVPQWYLDSCLKIKYMFPKAHAAAYVIAAMRLAWYKIYYPVEYYATYLTVRGGDLETDKVLAGRQAVKMRMAELNELIKQRAATKKEEDAYTSLQVMNEMMARGVEILPIDIYKSKGTRYVVEDGKIRLPFASIPGCGENAAISLENAKFKKVKVTKEDGSTEMQVTDEIEEFVSIDDIQDRSKAPQTIIDILEESGAFGDIPKSTQISFF